MAKILKFTSKKSSTSSLQKQNNLQLKPIENSELYQRRAHSRENLLLGGDKSKNMTDYEIVNTNLNNNANNVSVSSGSRSVTETITCQNNVNLIRLVTIWIIYSSLFASKCACLSNILLLICSQCYFIITKLALFNIFLSFQKSCSQHVLGNYGLHAV